MTDDKIEKAERRRRQLAEILEHLYANNRSEFARDLKVSSSLIAMMLRGEREVSDKFALHLIQHIQDLLETKAHQLYHARDVALELGRELVPGFDLPLIVSNEDHKAQMDEIMQELREREESGEEPDPGILEEIHAIIRNDRKPRR
ncbi:hypothetical protein [Devosia nitrariae]|uniref:HTH cro/C1-type domain-containing protein n=1 Tax=Devosia nitrariae TaxID=2071872 RepID=A0ABQ5W1G7_9HYPH|nr:hypothetical protein [Devosia nitrariae]GLQ53566.1 hypothetical protein GCM10010862_08250 [Devosia nitrariae]